MKLVSFATKSSFYHCTNMGIYEHFLLEDDTLDEGPPSPHIGMYSTLLMLTCKLKELKQKQGTVQIRFRH